MTSHGENQMTLLWCHYCDITQIFQYDITVTFLFISLWCHKVWYHTVGVWWHQCDVTSCDIMLWQSCDVTVTGSWGHVLTGRVNPYIPNPLRCYRCQDYGHGANRCTRQERCWRCGQSHVNQNWNKEPSCVNCLQKHETSDRTCKRYLMEKRKKSPSLRHERKLKQRLSNHCTLPLLQRQLNLWEFSLP